MEKLSPTLTDCGGVESGSVGLDGSKEVEEQGTVELTGERLEFSSPDTIVSPRKPQRTVDRAIAILDKADKEFRGRRRTKRWIYWSRIGKRRWGKPRNHKWKREGQGMENVRRRKQRRKEEIELRRKQEKQLRVVPGTQWKWGYRKQNRKRRRRREITRWKEKYPKTRSHPFRGGQEGGVLLEDRISSKQEENRGESKTRKT